MDKIREQTYYVGLYSDGGYVGIDDSSGGYPFNAGGALQAATLFQDTPEGKKRLTDYVDLFRHLTVGKVEVIVFTEEL